jgi:hypothetical protein
MVLPAFLKTMITTVLFLPVVGMISKNDNRGPANTAPSDPLTPAAVSGTQNQEADARKGWTVLFDGKTTKGWHTYGKNKAGAIWTVKDGALYLDVSKRNNKEKGDLVTDQEYENYHLQLEWKISKGGNSGIIFNVKEDPEKYPNTYYTGPEMQVLDDAGHADGKIYKHRSGDLYDLIASSTEAAKPVGEWNKVDIVLNKGKLSFSLNGVNIVNTTLFNEDWNKMIAGSKFASMEGFGTFRSGKIALQDHGDEVWYRNIRIKKL